MNKKEENDVYQIVEVNTMNGSEEINDEAAPHNLGGHMKWMIALHVLPILILVILNYLQIEVGRIGQFLIFMIMILSHIPMMFSHKKQ